MEGGRHRLLRCAGIALLVASLFLPIHGCRAEPWQFEPEPPGPYHSWIFTWSPLLVPLEAIPAYAARGWDQGGLRLAAWEARFWYPYFLLPLWIMALLGARRFGRRRGIGLALVCASTAVASFEAIYLWGDMEGLGPRSTRPMEVLAVWAVVVSILVWRVPGRRHVEDLEATISSQALLGAAHAVAFPAGDLYRYLRGGHGPWSSFAALSCNYRYGLWIAVVGFLLVARPGYFSGVSQGEGYDSPLPWRPRSSTPTPTSTSTGSTPTGTPSSTAPAGPGSSPS